MTEFIDRFEQDTEYIGNLDRLQDLAAWWAGRPVTAQRPNLPTDVDIRSNLLHLKLNGANPSAIQSTVAAYKPFYAWAQAQELVNKSPFDEWDFGQPLLDSNQIRRRAETLSEHPTEREVARLRALNRIAEGLNQSADIQTLLNTTLEILVEVMGLKTAWAFLQTEAGLFTAGIDEEEEDLPLGFMMAGCCGLPQGLAQNDCRFLRQAPGCHCQYLLRDGRLARAVNVVECTRLPRAADAAEDIEGLMFHATVPLLSQGRPLGLINVATEEWEFLTAADLQLLTAVGTQVATALERAHLFEVAEEQRARLEAELDMARTVQRSLLPSKMPDLPGFTLAADWRSAREVAGDFYDVFPLSGGRWGIVMADVSGKGAPAALYMAMARSLIRSEAGSSSSPSAVLTAVNNRLRTESSVEAMFLTAFYAILDPEVPSITYTNAGHDPPFIRRASGQTERLPPGGFILGLLDGVDQTDETLYLEPGDILVTYTDGLTDARNDQGEDYTDTRLEAAIAKAPANASDLMAHLLNGLMAFVEETPQMDDITLLILERT